MPKSSIPLFGDWDQISHTSDQFSIDLGNADISILCLGSSWGYIIRWYPDGPYQCYFNWYWDLFRTRREALAIYEKDMNLRQPCLLFKFDEYDMPEIHAILHHHLIIDDPDAPAKPDLEVGMPGDIFIQTFCDLSAFYYPKDLEEAKSAHSTWKSVTCQDCLAARSQANPSASSE